MAIQIGQEVSEIEQLATNVRDAGKEYIDAGQTLVEASEALALVERERATQKLAAIIRICGQEHPAAKGKQFSVSQADDFAQLDPEYAKYKQRCSDLSLARLEADIGLAAARLAAEYAIAAFKVAGGLR